MMDRIREAMTRKIGPLPAWAWGGLAAGGVWAWRGFRGTLTQEPEPRSTVGSGDGLMAGMPSFGAPAGDPSPLYVTADDYGFSIDGDPGSSLTALEWLLAQSRTSTETGGGGTVPAAPEPTSQPATTTTTTTVTATRYRLSPLGGSQIIGIYDTRLACSQAAQAYDPNSNPPGSSMGCYQI